MTTEDNEDQEARDVVALSIASATGADEPSWYTEELAQRILSALSEAGYTVVKTQWEYGTGPSYERNGLSTRDIIQRRRVVGPWIPVPESDTLGSGEQ